MLWSGRHAHIGVVGLTATAASDHGYASGVLLVGKCFAMSLMVTCAYFMTGWILDVMDAWYQVEAMVEGRTWSVK